MAAQNFSGGLFYSGSTMSRSRRKSPVMGITTARSEKEDKRKANRSLRRTAKVAVRAEREVMPEIKDVSNAAMFAKDGRQRFNPHREGGKWMRK